MKKGLLGALAAMFATSGNAQNDYLEFKAIPKLDHLFSNKLPKGCRPTQPSEYFGRRSEVVTAYTKNGEQKMKLKNALKGNHKFDFIT